MQMAQIIWYIRERSFADKSKKIQDPFDIYDDDINNGGELEGDNIDVNELMNDLGEASARIIDDISIFESNNNLQSPILLEIFNLQLIETALVQVLIPYQ